MRLAVVILNWNGEKHLKTFLPSVIEHSKDIARIIVADNASTDNSIEFIKANFPSVEIVQNDENGGFAKGYNDVLKKIDAEFYVLLNSDVEVTENWIKPIVDLFDSNPEIGICQPKLRSFLEKDKFEYAGAAGGFIDFMGYPFCRGRIFQHVEIDYGQYDQTTEIFWASGAAMFIRSSIFHQLGGFDETYFAHMEEIDLCWRAKNQGHKVFFCPDSVVYHLGGGTLHKSSPHKNFLNFRNSLLTLYKNDNSNFRHLKIFGRLLLDSAAYVKILTDSGFGHANSIIKAHFSFYRTKKTKSSKGLKEVSGIYKGSIVLEHYFNGKMKFSQLKKGFSRSKK